MVEMEKALLKKMCRDQDLYVTPAINDKLYLHYKGFRSIKNLDEYTGLKVLWLEGNGLSRIEGLEHQGLLKTLYLQENLIQKIENLDAQPHLDTLNLAQNQISKIENLGHMKELTSLSLKSNYLVTAKDIEHVLQLPNLSVLDVQSNRITDPDILEVFAKMPNLKVLYLQGNDVVKHIKQYRKTVIYRCRKLKYLDDRPVFEDERRRIEAWGKALHASGGDYKAAQEAERDEMDKIRQEKKDRDRMNFLHFEQLMAEGRRKRQEEEAKKQNADNQHPESTEPEINPFSGEKIVPVQDCEFLQRQREHRWEQVVNSPEAWSKDTVSSTDPTRGTDNQQEGSTTSIPVDSQRMDLLHQCATVGAGGVSARDAFVDSAFQIVGNTSTGAPSQPPPVPHDAHRERIKEKAALRVQELKLKKREDIEAQTRDLRLSPATQLIGCSLSSPSILVEEEHNGPPSSSGDQVLVLPPPAPVEATNRQSTAAHTNVDELD